MYLERIAGPADLRDLSYPELNDLAGEIRDFVVSAVSDTGGHLGSNLGAVELTLALHRVFDSPTDAILWDTGHQAYIHKIVTGRQRQFEQLRQQGGLSGYPSREESEHDYVENSHASTILSYAYGMAVARDLGVDHHRHIVAVLGDGSMTGGMAYEAINNIGHGDKRVIVVLNDNGRSYAPTVSMLSASVPEPRRARQPSERDRRGHREAVARADRHPTQPGLRPPSTPPRGVPPAPAGRRPSGRLGDGGVQGRRPRVPPAAVVLRGARRPVRRPVRRAQHRGDGARVPQRDRAVGGGTDPRARPDPEGPRLPARRGRRREAPPRRAGVRPAGRAAEGRRHRVHPGVRRGDREGSRGRQPHRGDHGGDAGPDRIAAVPGSVPGSLLRRRDRRATCGHGRRRHGDGRSASRRRDLLDVPQPGVGPGRLRRGDAPPAGDLLPRPRRDHRTGRCQPSRRLRHGVAREGARHARARPVERAGTRPDAPRRDDARRVGSGRDPLPARSRPTGDRVRGRVRTVGPQGPLRKRHRASSPSARCWRWPRRPPRNSPPTASR